MLTPRLLLSYPGLQKGLITERCGEVSEGSSFEEAGACFRAPGGASYCGDSPTYDVDETLATNSMQFPMDQISFEALASHARGGARHFMGAVIFIRDWTSVTDYKNKIRYI